MEKRELVGGTNVHRVNGSCNGRQFSCSWRIDVSLLLLVAKMHRRVHQIAY